MLKEFILATYIPCDVCAYGPFHVVFFLCGLIVCIGLSFNFKNLNNKQNDRLLFVIGILLILMESYKQLYYYYQNDTYVWSIFPFHLCDIPVYLCVITFFLKEGKLKNTFYYFMSTYTLLSGFISFLEPSGLIHDNWFLTIHAFVWHMTLVFIGVYLIISKRVPKRKYYFLLSSILFVFLCIVAFIINCTLNEVSNHSINMFFVGPQVNN